MKSRGTAIGSALAVVTNRMRESESKSKVCILLSDGDNTAGNIDPITSAELAAAYGYKNLYDCCRPGRYGPLW
ncbi:MAG: VWA domain-containing protein [Cytophagales bacterium]|nr:VWA domain-containing protein [Cytophagales bacterium]